MDTIDKINALLAEKGMTGAELSRLLGVTNSVYSQWNKRKTTPKMSRMPKIAEILGVSVADLLPDNENTAPEASAPKTVSDDDIKFSLFGSQDISDELFEEVKRYAKYALEQEKFKKFHQQKG